MVSKLLRTLVAFMKWFALALVCVEVISFLVIVISNYILYGHPREGSRAVYDPHTLFLMSAGVRPTSHNSRSPDNNLNREIWIFGGSTLRGDTGDNEKTIPSLLAQYLNTNIPPLHFTVVNFGVNSFNSLLETKYLHKNLIEADSKPDLILFYDGANDSKYVAEYRSPHGHYGYRKVRSIVESYYKGWFGLLKPLNAALSASFTKELYDKVHQVLIPIDPQSSLLAETVDSIERRYDHVDRIARCYGVSFLVVLQPMLWVEICCVTDRVRNSEKSSVLNADRYATMRHNFAVTYAACTQRLERKSYFVSLQDALCERTAPAYKTDGVHLTDNGREIMAQRIGNILNTSFFHSATEAARTEGREP
ncbi:SGNH/GDSL hydrolase family protein [Thermodesulfobacteriota bacterium]